MGLRTPDDDGGLRPLAVLEPGMGFGGETYLIKCGTYQDSEFGWRHFGNDGRP